MKRLYQITAAILIPSLMVFVVLVNPGKVLAATDSFTSSGTWTAPAGVTVVQVNAWGAGGAGTSPGSNRGGGGGGAYAGLNAFTVIPGDSYVVTVGQPDAVGIPGSTMGTTTFAATSTLSAAPGWGAILTTGGLGGAIASSTGDIIHAGGSGGNGSGGWGGSGGGSGGTIADGSPGTTSSSSCINGIGGSGGSVGGGNGGSSNIGTAPTSPGGGGYGSSSALNCTARLGVTGAQGEVDITYTLPTAPSSGNIQIQGAQVIIRGGNTVWK